MIHTQCDHKDWTMIGKQKAAACYAINMKTLVTVQADVKMYECLITQLAAVEHHMNTRVAAVNPFKCISAGCGVCCLQDNMDPIRCLYITNITVITNQPPSIQILLSDKGLD